MSQVTKEALNKAIEVCKPGVKFSKIGEVIEKHAKENGFTVYDEAPGSGIGEQAVQAPLVHHHKVEGDSVEMKEGMVFTISPTLMLSPTWGTINWNDGTSVQTPGNPSANWKHTVLVTGDGS